jgi:hypothetical protein
LQRWDNGTGYMANVLNAYLAFTKPKIAYLNSPTITFHKGINEFFAIPQSAIDIQNAGGQQHLVQNPGY